MNKKLITLFEDVQTTLQLTETEKKDILELKNIWGSQNLTLEADGTILMKHYVGFVSSGETRLQILPKVYSDTEAENIQEESRDACELLLRLLTYSGYLSGKDIPKPQDIEGFNNDLLEIFINIFTEKFLEYFSTDTYRRYENTEENLQFIKGKILFQQSILKNSFTNHKHYVEYEEFTVNTLLNRIFKALFMRLIYKTQISSNKIKIKLALTYLEDVDTIALSENTFNNMHFNRLNERYRPLFNMAKLFYKNYQPGFKEGDESTFTFLIPLNKLFEYYIYKLLENSSPVINGGLCSVNFQKPQEYLGEWGKNKMFLLKPDITLTSSGKIKVIIDAKYKRLKYKEETYLSQDDIYQMIAYAGHYECREILLVYPLYKGEKLREEPNTVRISIFNNEVIIKIVQLDIMEKDIDVVRDKLLRNIV